MYNQSNPMNKIISLLFIFTVLFSYSQAPEGINYQALVRDNDGNPLANTSVGIKISIYQGSVSGSIVFEEEFSPNTNQFGLVNLVIGQGALISGDFASIDWGLGPYFVEVSADESGGTNYELLGTQELMSVPYALHSITADSIKGGINRLEQDPVFSSSVASSITSADISLWNMK